MSTSSSQKYQCEVMKYTQILGDRETLTTVASDTIVEESILYTDIKTEINDLKMNVHFKKINRPLLEEKSVLLLQK